MISDISSKSSEDELAAEDGLLVIAKGLGLEIVLINVLRLHTHNINLCILINTSQQEFDSIRETLGPEHSKFLTCINNETPAKLRAQLYLGGGVMVRLE